MASTNTLGPLNTPLQQGKAQRMGTSIHEQLITWSIHSHTTTTNPTQYAVRSDSTHSTLLAVMRYWLRNRRGWLALAKRMEILQQQIKDEEETG